MVPLKGINTKWEGEKKFQYFFSQTWGLFFNKEKEMRVQLYTHTLAITSKLNYTSNLMNFVHDCYCQSYLKTFIFKNNVLEYSWQTSL